MAYYTCYEQSYLSLFNYVLVILIGQELGILEIRNRILHFYFSNMDIYVIDLKIPLCLLEVLL